jgi:hypothetical protein
VKLGVIIRDQLTGTCLRYLHSHHHVAVAQSRHAFIYDQNLVELHRLSALIEPAFLEFLPYHWLLVCAVCTMFLVLPCFHISDKFISGYTRHSILP